MREEYAKDSHDPSLLDREDAPLAARPFQQTDISLARLPSAVPASLHLKAFQVGLSAKQSGCPLSLSNRRNAAVRAPPASDHCLPTETKATSTANPAAPSAIFAPFAI